MASAIRAGFAQSPSPARPSESCLPSLGSCCTNTADRWGAVLRLPRLLPSYSGGFGLRRLDAAEHHRLLDRLEAGAERVTEVVVGERPRPANSRLRTHNKDRRR